VAHRALEERGSIAFGPTRTSARALLEVATVNALLVLVDGRGSLAVALLLAFLMGLWSVEEEASFLSECAVHALDLRL
jgi:hypothetical protein